ncbi:MAG: hypothetical protein ACNA8W_07995 [Bradymonadaceae bacterium]
MTYFTPDRSNRPTDDDDHTGGTTEVTAAKPKHVELADGRVAVTEAAMVDDFTLLYYYFDRTGLEDATTPELGDFLRRSGIKIDPVRPGISASFGSSKTEDARGRPIWEFQITYVD